jgi:hypothetical protein
LAISVVSGKGNVMQVITNSHSPFHLDVAREKKTTRNVLQRFDARVTKVIALQSSLLQIYFAPS